MSERDAGRLSLRAIEVLVAVVEEGSLGGGARRLGASPSSVSQHITNLEEALGARLIVRTARSFVLTQAGKLFYRRALSILDEIGRARSELARLDTGAVRELAIAVIEEMEADILPAIVDQLADIYPNCNFVMRAGHSHSNVEALEARAVDLIVTVDADNLPDWVERWEVLHDPLVLVVARSLGFSETPSHEQLLSAPMVRFTREQLLARQIEAHLRRARLAPPRRFEVETNRSMLATVVRERGWAVTTALGVLSARRFHGEISVCRLMSATQARVLTLCSRRDVLGVLPEDIADAMRNALAELVLPAAQELMPWLEGTFRIPTSR